jgi:hypothetical protein
MNWLVVEIIVKYKKMKIYKKGDKVTWNGGGIISGNGNLSQKKVLVVTSRQSSANYDQYGGYYTVKTEAGGAAGYVYGNEIKGFAITKAELTEELKNLEKSKKEIEEKIDLMSKFDMEVYDENVIKAHSVLEVIGKNKLNNVDKAKLIAKLINSEV